MTQDCLDLMGSISGIVLLEFKPGAILRAVKTDALGTDCFWSPDMLYRQLQFLEDLVPEKEYF